MIGLVSAEKREIDGILKLMDNKNEEIFGPFKFIKGKINNQECIAVLSGVGKVFSSICTQTLILKYSPDFILNIGVSGGIGKKVNILDVVVAKEVVQYDFDISPLQKRKKSEIPDLNLIEIPCSSWIVKNILNSTKNTIKDIKIHCGTIVTGDKFINSPTKVEFDGLACDMESGSIGQTCYLNKIEFGIIRGISDKANSTAHVDYENYIEKASENASQVLYKFLETI